MLLWICPNKYYTVCILFVKGKELEHILKNTVKRVRVFICVFVYFQTDLYCIWREMDEDLEHSIPYIMSELIYEQSVPLF